MINRKVLIFIVIMAMAQSIPVFAGESFLEDLNKGIDSAQESINKAADHIDAAAEVIGEVVDDTKVVVEETVEAIKVALSDLDNHWAKQYIDELIGKKVVSGYPDGTFKPNASISVSEFTKVLMAGVYDDIDYQESTPWYQSYLDVALDKGIIETSEYGDYTREITRYEMARMIARAGEDKEKIKIEETDATKFEDDANITTEGKKYIMAVSDVGIITGYPNGTFGPDNEATRAEASVMLNRFLELEDTEKVDVVEEPSIKIKPLTDVQLIEIDADRLKYDGEYDDYQSGFVLNDEKTRLIYEYENYPSISDYQHEVVRVLLAYAIEKELFLNTTYGSAELFKQKSHMTKQYGGFYRFGFRDNPIDFDENGNGYNLNLKINYLHNLEEVKGESQSEGRARLEAADFETQYLTDGLEDSLEVLFPKESDELLDLILKDYHDNMGKEYSYWDLDYVTIGDYRIMRNKGTGAILYEFVYNYDK